MIQINPREVAAEALMEIMMADAYNTMTLRRLLRQKLAQWCRCISAVVAVAYTVISMILRVNQAFRCQMTGLSGARLAVPASRFNCGLDKCIVAGDTYRE